MTTKAKQMVLVVDDQPEVALSTQTVLIEIGVDEVMIARSVCEALAQLEQSNFDLAVLDYNLGTETGWAVAKALCEDGIPIIVTTDAEGVELPAACGGAAILKRPYNLNDLAALVATA